jgi:hypothetical protein
MLASAAIARSVTYAAANRYVAQEFIDVETAKAAGRSGFGEMIAFLKKQTNCRVVLVEKTDRLYRNLRDVVTIDELGLDLHSVKENVIPSPDSRSHKKFMHGIKVLGEKLHRQSLRRDTKGDARESPTGDLALLCAIRIHKSDRPGRQAHDRTRSGAGAGHPEMYERYATGKYALKEIVGLARADGMAYRKSGDPVPKSTIHKILRNRVYTGDFVFDGATYKGTYEPIVSRELWEQVQLILSGRGTKKTRKVKESLAFGGLIRCGHCGYAMVGEIKKGRYVYYYCTGYKGKCPERYTREDVLEKRFTELLEGISFSPEVLTWVTQVLRESHADERKCHEEAITKLQREHRRIQDRIDAMYMDKLDGLHRYAGNSNCRRTGSRAPGEMSCCGDVGS